MFRTSAESRLIKAHRPHDSGGLSPTTSGALRTSGSCGAYCLSRDLSYRPHYSRARVMWTDLKADRNGSRSLCRCCESCPWSRLSSLCMRYASPFSTPLKPLLQGQEVAKWQESAVSLYVTIWPRARYRAVQCLQPVLKLRTSGALPPLLHSSSIVTENPDRRFLGLHHSFQGHSGIGRGRLILHYLQTVTIIQSFHAI
jgi:hypothetical protein